MRAVLLTFLVLANWSPAEPTVIDGSSEDKFAATTEQARRDLPVAERLHFDRALAGAPTRRFGAKDKEALKRVSFDGMTAAEVVADYRTRQR